MNVPLGDDVTVIRRTAASTDDYGNDVFTTTETVVKGCVVAPRNSSELIQDQDIVIVGLTVYMPYGTDILSTDQVNINSVVYDVDGVPGSFRSPLTASKGPVQVALTRYTG
jgi:hypothetical protein